MKATRSNLKRSTKQNNTIISSFIFAILISFIGMLFIPSVSKNTYIFFPAKTNFIQRCAIASHVTYFPFLLAFFNKKGLYFIPCNSSIFSIYRLKNTSKLKIHLREGLTNAQISQKLNNAFGVFGCVKETSFAQGSLLSDTYIYEYGTKVSSLISSAKNALNAKKRQLWTKYSSTTRAKNIEQALILASIVVKECDFPEYQLVSSVFFNRLEQKIRLQSCATLIFITGKSSLLYSDLYISSPYNTYRNIGLPPGPIGIVSKRALEAVLQAPKHDYLFFVKNGPRHKFSKNFKEHIKAKVIHKHL